MNRMRLPFAMLCACSALAGAPALAQNFPSKPVRIVLTAAGGPTDLAARLISVPLTASLGQTVVVENRNGQLGIQAVRGAPADGHTLLSYGVGLWLTPMMDKTVTYDPVKDFTPVTLQTRVPNVLVVHPSVQVQSVKELIALAKGKPGALNVASGSPGSATGLAAAMFNSMANVNITQVPYNGGPAAIAALVAGQVQLMFATPGTVVGHIKAGKLRGVAVTGPETTPLAPDLPTVATTVPGFEVEAIAAVYGPAGLPGPIVNRLNQEIGRAMNQADIREKLFSAGVVVATGTPEQLSAYMKADIARVAKLIKEGALKVE